MNRFGVFSIYDKDGVLDNTTLSTIIDLRSCISYFVVVVNGSLHPTHTDTLSTIADKLVFRKNVGFDSGAYKDVFFHYLTPEQISLFDEVVLCNDTFYGPFIPFHEIFSSMENKEWDFWGMRYVPSPLIEHMQSYFYCFSSSVFQQAVLPYFNTFINESATQLFEVYARFEQGLFAHLIRQGFRYATYAHSSGLRINASSYYVLTDDHLPLLKKKAFDPKEMIFDNIIASLRYIQTHFGFDIAPILESAHRKYGFSMTAPQILAARYKAPPRLYREQSITASRDSLYKFLAKFRGVYIYGSGQWGQILYAVYVEESGKMLGFVCSDKAHVPATGQVLGVPVHPLCDIHPDDDTGIVVALGADNTKSVRPLLSAFSPSQLYYLYD